MKILVLQLKRIGDLILTTPALRCLRDAFPQAHITLASDATCRSLLAAIPVDEHWVYEKSSGWGAFFGTGPNAWVRSDLPAFRSAVMEAVDRVNRQVTLTEKVRNITLTPDGFTIDNEMLTPSLKIRRHMIRQVYGEQIDALYRG